MASKSGRYVRDKLGRFASTGSSGGEITSKQMGQVGLGGGMTTAQATKQLAKDGFYNTPNGIKHVSQLTPGQRAEALNQSKIQKGNELFAKLKPDANRTKAETESLKKKYLITSKNQAKAESISTKLRHAQASTQRSPNVKKQYTIAAKQYSRAESIGNKLVNSGASQAKISRVNKLKSRIANRSVDLYGKLK